MTLTFSDGVNLNLSPSTFGCSNVYGFAATTMACARTSSTLLTVTNSFPNADRFLILQLSNFILPGYVNTFTVTVATYTSARVLIDTSEGSTFKFDTNPGSLTLSLSALTSQVVGAYGNLQVNVKVSNTLASSGYILMKLPKWNPGT